MEELAQYIWQHRLYKHLEFFAPDGSHIEAQLIDPGTLNTDAGADFFNAKIRFGSLLLAGSVEIHLKSTDWYKHEHHKDPSYNNVILHVVYEHDGSTAVRQNGSALPYCLMHVSEQIKEKAAWLLHTEQRPACADILDELNPIERSKWMERLLIERLERKAEDILRIFQSSQTDWSETCYILIARYFGFGLNNEAMERLARSLPLRYIQKHRNSLLQIEALLLGQANLLSEEDSDPYRERLANEYQFLSKKFGLSPLPRASFKLHRIRPAGFPHRRIAQLAALLYRHEFILSQLINANSADELMQIFDIETSEYWWQHYRFGMPSKKRNKGMSKASKELLLINVLSPLLLSYGRQTGNETLATKGLRILEELKPESNALLDRFIQAGIPIAHAADSQAIIQLHKEYCQARKCLYCHCSYRYLQGQQTEPV